MAGADELGERLHPGLDQLPELGIASGPGGDQLESATADDRAAAFPDSVQQASAVPKW
ncbi:MAG TPA: hypothetical protein VIT65_02550 [Microlunatus sp.]